MRIRHLNYPSDLPALMSFMPELYESNFPGFVANADFLSRKRSQVRDASRDPGQQILVAQDDYGVCGFIWVVIEIEHSGRRRGEVSAVYAARRVRGKGVGRLLMEEGESVLISYGCDSVNLMVTSSNDLAVGLYQRMGYSVQRYQMEKSLRKGPK